MRWTQRKRLTDEILNIGQTRATNENWTILLQQINLHSSQRSECADSTCKSATNGQSNHKSYRFETWNMPFTEKDSAEMIQPRPICTTEFLRIRFANLFVLFAHALVFLLKQLDVYLPFFLCHLFVYVNTKSPVSFICTFALFIASPRNRLRFVLVYGWAIM